VVQKLWLGGLFAFWQILRRKFFSPLDFCVSDQQTLYRILLPLQQKWDVPANNWVEIFFDGIGI
jgi:hypothetical protein